MSTALKRITPQEHLFHEDQELSANFDLKSLNISIVISELYRGVKSDPIEDNADINSGR